MNIFTDGWVVSSESDHFASFSELSDEEKRIQHLIDDLYLPTKCMYRIYKKGNNIVVAVNTLTWMFKKNRFFIKSDFDTLATVTPTRVFSTRIDTAARLVCKHLGFTPDIHINKILFRQIIKKGKEAYDEYLEKNKFMLECNKWGYSWDDIKTYTDCPHVFLQKLQRNGELRDLLCQAKQLNRVINTSWSERRIHDEHMKWTEEIHKLKTRNCSDELIWTNIPCSLPECVILLNSEKAIADEGSNMHHCIYTNYRSRLLNRKMIAFHVQSEDGDFTCSFFRHENSTTFDQAHKAWNKPLNDEQMNLARSLISYAALIFNSEPLKSKTEDIPLLQFFD